MAAPSTRALSRAEIEARIDALPTLPAVVAALMGLSPSSEQYSLRVRELVVRDPPFAVRIMKVANSASFAAVTPVLSLPEALVRLGARQVAQLITAVSVMRVFVPTTEGHRNLWRHAIQVAVGARTIASRGPREVDPQRAYAVGLLHDIGRFVMFEHDPVDFEVIDGKHWSTPAELLAAERDVCGFDHAELGWRASTIWALPEEISDPIRLHHATVFDSKTPRARVALIKTVQQADALSCLMLSRPDLTSLDPLVAQEVIERVCPPPGFGTPPASAADLSSIIGPIQNESSNLAAALGLGTS